MTIEITRPELEALIQQRLQSGSFTGPEDVILAALRSFEPLRPTGMNGQKKALAFAQWAKSHHHDTPPLSDEAVSRANLVRDVL